ncbi:MAG: hypothetical protein LBP42_01135 [Treponema sp.]|jgi:hypothetical protein|nr:hypothetical protein [Treponema sp.]
MRFKVSLILVVFCSLALGFCLLTLVRFFLPAPSSGAYGMLSLDAACNDREIGALLTREGIDDFISESTQWFFLDDFERLREIPLDRYPDQLEPFDPRNDGYAEKLHSFFVRGGRRFFFIPLPPDFAGRERRELERRVSRSLEGIPYSLLFRGIAPPFFWFFILFLFAAAGTLLLSGTPLLWAAYVPLLLPLFIAGSPGFALSAILAGFFFIFREPLRGYFVFRRSRSRYFLREPSLVPPSGGRFKIIALYGFLSLVLSAAYGAVCGLGNIPPPLGLAFFVSFGLVFFLSLSAESRWEENPEHVHFKPVPIMDFALNLSFFPGIILPFGLASFLSLFVPSPMADSAGPFPEEAFTLISPLEYKDHVFFQSSFSLTPLGDWEGEGDNDYTQYAMAGDGLISGEPEDFQGNRDEGRWDLLEGIPPFPLEPLMSFLENTESAGEGRRGFRDFMPPAIILLAGVPLFFFSGGNNRKNKKIPVYHDKRIAA